MTAISEALSDLLNCPFCGWKPDIAYDEHAAEIYCPNEECIGVKSVSYAESIYAGNPLEHAVAAWNRRLSTPPVGAETGEPVAAKRLTDKDMRDGMPCDWPACGCDFDAKCSDAPPRSDKANGDWVMVPREPTPEMRLAALTHCRKVNPGRSEDHIKATALDAVAAYRAMIAASLVSQGAGE